MFTMILGSIKLNTYLVASDNLTQESQDSCNHLGVVLHEPLLYGQMPPTQKSQVILVSNNKILLISTLLFSLFPCLSSL